MSLSPRLDAPNPQMLLMRHRRFLYRRWQPWLPSKSFEIVSRAWWRCIRPLHSSPIFEIGPFYSTDDYFVVALYTVTTKRDGNRPVHHGRSRSQMTPVNLRSNRKRKGKRSSETCPMVPKILLTKIVGRTHSFLFTIMGRPALQIFLFESKCLLALWDMEYRIHS